MMLGVRQRTLKFLKWLALLATGAAGSLIFAPYQNIAAGYAAVVLFLSFLFFKQRSKKEAFWLSYVFGFGFFGAGFSWICNALLVDGGGVAAFIPLVFMALGLFFGLFWALPAAMAARGENIYSKMLLFCGFFVIFEWIRSFIFTGFPWNLLGTALGFNERLIQGAAYVGVYGLSWFLLLFLCGAALVLLSILQRRFYVWSAAFILVPAAFFYWGAGKYFPVAGDGMVVRLVQPSIPQTLKWAPELFYANFRSYIDLSKKGKEDGATEPNDVDIAVWGEAASPYLLDRDEAHLREITEAVPAGGFLITGSLRTGFENGEAVPYNSMFVIDKNGVIKDYYDKAHLVPFGEYLPFRKYWPEFMAPVANVVGDLGRGEKYKNIHVKGLPVIGGAICYESIFPKEVLNPVEKPDLLVVLANDGWYGVSSGPYQHLAAAQMRAVEEGVTVIRSANTGISAVIMPNGEIKGALGLNETGISDVRLSKVMSRPTVYGKFGNAMWGVLAVCSVLFAVFCDIFRRRRRVKKLFS